MLNAEEIVIKLRNKGEIGTFYSGEWMMLIIKICLSQLCKYERENWGGYSELWNLLINPIFECDVLHPYLCLYDISVNVDSQVFRMVLSASRIKMQIRLFWLCYNEFIFYWAMWQWFDFLSVFFLKRAKCYTATKFWIRIHCQS